MEPVEQVFLRVRSVDGFRTAEIAAATELVRVSDMTEIVGWFTDTESNSIIRFDTLNVFFHPLPSGDFAIGMIYPDQRGFFSFLHPPKSFFARILIVPPRTLLEKGNNPPAFLEELRRRRKVPLVSRAPKRLMPIQPLKTPPPFDRETLEVLADSPGPAPLAGLFQSLFDSECTFLFSGKRPVTTILAGLFELLPLGYRTELTFSTDLFFSVQTPFRIIGMSGPRRLALEQAKAIRIPLVILEKDHPPKTLKGISDVREPWPEFVRHVLESRQFDFLEKQWAIEYDRSFSTFDEESPLTTDWENLHGLAVSWMKKMKADSGQAGLGGDSVRADIPEAFRCLDTVEELLPLIDEENRIWSKQQQRMIDKDVMSAPQDPKTVPNLVSGLMERLPHLREDLQVMDSLLARAFFGDATVLPGISEAWKKIRAKTTWDEREKICEEYISLTRSIFLVGPEQSEARQVERSAIFLELVSVFLEKH